ncbi:MAG TPA: hypothetical protein VF290_17325 [Pyrinomonadaceae bacterium]
MADPKTVLEYATNRNAAAAQAVTDAQQRLAGAQSDLAQVNADQQAASTELATLEAQAASIRQKLSVIATPADGEALLDALEQTTVRIRATQSAVVKIQGRFSIATANMAQVQTELAAATAQQQQAAAALVAATDANTAREELSNALGNPPLTEVNIKAGKALDESDPDGVAFKEAKERIEGDIPPKLVERAHARREQERKLINDELRNNRDAEDAVLKEGATTGGLAKVAAQAWTAFKRAEDAARNFVGGAESRLVQAKAALVQVGDPDQSPLTPEQKARITDPDLNADREAAADGEETLHTTVAKDLADKQLLLDEAILKAKADPSAANLQAVTDARGDVDAAQNAFNTADQAWREKETLLAAAVDNVEAKQAAVAEAIQQAVAGGNDPETDPGVIQAKDDLATAEDDRKSAEDDYKASPHGTLDLWETAVPDATWLLFDKYEHAVETLNALKTANPATLKNDLKTTEEAYVAAQLAADKSSGVLAQLTAEQSHRAVRQDSAQKTSDARLFSALRGDA